MQDKPILALTESLLLLASPPRSMILGHASVPGAAGAAVLSTSYSHKSEHPRMMVVGKVAPLRLLPCVDSLQIDR